MSSNSFADMRRPFARSDIVQAAWSPVGAAPTEPSEAWMFCFETAAITSSVFIPCAAMRAGSSHTRIESFGPYTVASPTPLTRRSTGWMFA